MPNDLVLETLLASRNEVAPDLDVELLRQCYEIQKRHQFDRDRATPTQAMERLIDDHVNSRDNAGRGQATNT